MNEEEILNWLDEHFTGDTKNALSNMVKARIAKEPVRKFLRSVGTCRSCAYLNTDYCKTCSNMSRYVEVNPPIATLYNVCPVCGTVLADCALFCNMCGQAIKWG